MMSDVAKCFQIEIEKLNIKRRLYAQIRKVLEGKKTWKMNETEPFRIFSRRLTICSYYSPRQQPCDAWLSRTHRRSPVSAFYTAMRQDSPGFCTGKMERYKETDKSLEQVGAIFSFLPRRFWHLENLEHVIWQIRVFEIDFIFPRGYIIYDKIQETM